MVRVAYGALRAWVEGFFAAVVSSGLRAFEIQIHHNRILTASDNDRLARHIRAGNHLLMSHIGRNVNEDAGPVLAWGSTTTVPAHNLLAPVRARVMAAARVMPGV